MTEALIVVDMQNLFVDVAGAAGPSVVRAVNALVAEAVAEGRPVFFTRDYAPIDLPEGDPQGRTALHPELDLRGTVVEKGPGKRGAFSGFLYGPVLEPQEPAGTGGLGALAGLLAESGTTSVTVVGIAADVCVAATARDAMRLGYPARIPLHATAFVHAHPDGDEAAVAELRTAGVTVTGPVPSAETVMAGPA